MLQFLGVICAVSWCGKCWIGCGIKGVMLNRKVTGLKWRFCFCFSSGINGTIGFILCIHDEILHFLGSLRPTCLFLVYAMCIFFNVLYICHKCLTIHVHAYVYCFASPQAVYCPSMERPVFIHHPLRVNLFLLTFVR